MSESQRRLAAILAADVAGYSRMMGEDEAATVAALDSCRGVFREHIEGGGGRVVDMAGDSVLAVFASVVEAVSCADAVQLALADEGMRFRIGVHIGDVIEKPDGTIYGDGVNIAARLESLAEPGGIMVSASAFEQIEGKLDLAFEDAGEHEVKNIARPVRGHRLAGDAPAAEPPPLPSKPSIAVLAFDNMSGVGDQKYFADGVAEDLITALSRLRWLFVVARNSTFTYKGRAVDVKQVAQELGVRYVVEGSVRRGGNRVRISVQLIDGMTGNHVWAERYDRALDDIFDVQDEITETITAAIAPELEAVERERAHHRPPESLDVWEAFQRGMWHLYQFSEKDSVMALRLFRDAIKVAPDFAPLHAGLAYGQFLARVFGHGDADLDEALQAGRRAVASDDRDAMAHFALGRVLTVSGRIDDALSELKSALALNPSFALAHYGLAYCLVAAGRFEDAIAEIDIAERLSPRDPALWAFKGVRGFARLGSGDIQGALADARDGVRRPNASFGAVISPLSVLVAALGRLGDSTEAAATAGELRHENPAFRPAAVIDMFGAYEPATHEWFIEGLVRAGVPREGWDA